VLWGSKSRPERADLFLGVQSELLGALETPHHALARNPKLSGHLDRGQAVVAYGGVNDPGPRRNGRRPVTVAADLAAANREPSAGHAEQFSHNSTGFALGRQGAVLGQFGEHLGHELAGAEDAFIKGPSLPAALDLRGMSPAVPTASQPATEQIGPAPLAEAIANEPPVVGAGSLDRSRKVCQDEVGVVPRCGGLAHQCGVARPGVSVQGFEIVHQMRSDGVQVDVANQLQEVGFLFDHDGLEAVLEEVAGAVVTSVEADRIAGEESAHQGGKRRGSGASEEVEVVRDKAPGIEGGLCFDHQVGEPGEEIEAIGVGAKDLPALDATSDDVMEGVGCVEAGAARHDGHGYRHGRYLSSSDNVFLREVDAAYLRPSCPRPSCPFREVKLVDEPYDEDNLPLPREDVLKHLSYESLSQEAFHWDDLKFEILAECGNHKYWVWSVSDGGEASYAFIVKRPEGGSTLGLFSASGLSASDFVAWVQENFIEQAGVR
jgi:hypothetical protein